MEVLESQMEFILDSQYSFNLRSFIKDIATSRITEFIDKFLDRDLKDRRNISFTEFEKKFEEYICDETQITESDLNILSLEEKIEICQFADDYGLLSLDSTTFSYNDLIQIILKECCFGLDQLINLECCLGFISQLKVAMKEMGLELWQMTNENNLGWMAHEKELEPNHYVQVYCYRCIEGEMDFNVDVYELRFSGFNMVFEKSVEIPEKERQRNYEVYLEYGP